jgi:hypothetical protein
MTAKVQLKEFLVTEDSLHRPKGSIHFSNAFHMKTF